MCFASSSLIALSDFFFGSNWVNVLIWNETTAVAGGHLCY